MKKHMYVVIAMLVATVALTLGCAQHEGTTPVLDLSSAPDEGFTPLFNGEDFTGWDIEPDEGAWVSGGGVIHCKGDPRTPYLITTDESFENFDFYVDFRISEGCNSGIFYHVPPLSGRESRLGFETQILDDHGQPVTKTSSGSIYDVVTPFENAMKPAGKWNQYRVRFDWPSCKVWLNGILVQDTDFTTYKKLKYRLRSGPIGLSNHGHKVDYKNLWIKSLPATAEWADLFNGEDLTGWSEYGDADWRVEDGMLVATGGEGMLVTDDAYEDFHFQAWAQNDTLISYDSGFYYRWQSPEQPGYPADLFDFPAALETTADYEKMPPDIVPPWRYQWLLYQIISADRESQIRVNGDIIAENRLLDTLGPGRIAIHHAATDSVIRFQRIRLMQLEGPGI